MSAMAQGPPPGSALDPPPGRVLVAGDWHGNREWALSVIKRVPQLLAGEQTRLILQLGDSGIWPGTEGRRYLDSVSAVLDLVNAQLSFADGNHEDFPAACPAGRRRRCGRARRGPAEHLPPAARSPLAVDRAAPGWPAAAASSLDKAARTEGADWWPQEEITRGQEAAVAAGGYGGRDGVPRLPGPALPTRSGARHRGGHPPTWRATSAHRERLAPIVDRRAASASDAWPLASGLPAHLRLRLRARPGHRARCRRQLAELRGAGRGLDHLEAAPPPSDGECYPRISLALRISAVFRVSPQSTQITSRSTRFRNDHASGVLCSCPCAWNSNGSQLCLCSVVMPRSFHAKIRTRDAANATQLPFPVKGHACCAPPSPGRTSPVSYP